MFVINIISSISCSGITKSGRVFLSWPLFHASEFDRQMLKHFIMVNDIIVLLLFSSFALECITF